jgi:cytochrome d ubiquinol oxidase subunit I
MLNPAAAAEVLHMLLAAYMAVGIAVAGIHARLLLRNPGSHFHQAALAVALSVGLAPALLQPISGDYAAQVVARWQPAKLAAMEGQFRTEARAPLRIGGIPDARALTTRMAAEIPGGLSFLAYGDPDATVVGLADIPRDRWPPVLYVHLAFQLMVAVGGWLALLAVVTVWLRWRGRLFNSRTFLRLLVISTPLGFIAIEAGWTVTELGRQPWIIQGVMRTSQAVTPASGLTASLMAITVIYALLTLVVARLMRRQVFETQYLKD